MLRDNVHMKGMFNQLDIIRCLSHLGEVHECLHGGVTSVASCSSGGGGGRSRGTILLVNVLVLAVRIKVNLTYFACH